MQTFSSVRSQPIVLSSSTEAQVYLLFALAMALSVVGVFLGKLAFTLVASCVGCDATTTFASPWSSSVLLLCVIAEFAIILSSRWWMDSRPLNYVLFALFPLLSGFTFTPYIISILALYVNGASILLNALVSTVFMSLAAAVFARTTSWNLSGMGRILFFSVLGLLIFSLLQIFVPALRGPQFEMMLSGAGVVIFAAYTAYDLQRIQAMGRVGASPFMLALSLYLDIFNLFMFILRFMLSISGQRR